MYLRVPEVQRTLIIETRTDTQTDRGRIETTYTDNGATLTGALLDATPTEIERFQQAQRPITHTVKQIGPKLAEEGDRLTMDGRRFYIQTVENPLDMGIRTIYRVQERRDA